MNVQDLHFDQGQEPPHGRVFAILISEISFSHSLQRGIR